MEKERHQILNDSLRPLLFKFSYPPIIALVFGALYNMVDTIFVGKGVGTLAIAGLTIVLPIQIKNLKDLVETVDLLSSSPRPLGVRKVKKC